jgi:hypothetical protein
MCVSITPNQLVLATQDSPCLPPKVSPEQRAITATAADDIWAPEQMGKFLDHIATHRLGGCFALTLLGLRREEVGGLRWSDIDPHTGAAHPSGPRRCQRAAQQHLTDAGGGHRRRCSCRLARPPNA